MQFLEQLNRSYRIILGSKSPRRQFLLKEMGIRFRVAVSEGSNEEFPAELTRGDIAIFLARKKSSQLHHLLEWNSLLITVDTIVWLDNQVLGKPVNFEDAFNKLKKLSGRKHQVYSGVCLKSPEKEMAFSAKTDVSFKQLSDNEIRYYINTYEPYDKAGAYGVQEWIGFIGIELIEGSYFNVMGLPVERLYDELKKFANSSL